MSVIIIITLGFVINKVHNLKEEHESNLPVMKKTDTVQSIVPVTAKKVVKREPASKSLLQKFKDCFSAIWY